MRSSFICKTGYNASEWDRKVTGASGRALTVAEDGPLVRAVVVYQDLVDLTQALADRRAAVGDLARRALAAPDRCLDPLRIT